MASYVIPGTNITVSDALEAATRVAVLLGGIAYFAGLVVVNIHLGEYGVNVLGFFAPQYVTAGLLALVPATVGSGLWAMGSRVWILIRAEMASHAPRLHKILFGLLFSVFALLGMGVLTYATMTAPFWLMQAGNNAPASWWACLVLVLIVAANYKLVRWVVESGSAGDTRPQRAIGKLFAHSWGIALGAMGIAGYLALFGHVVYPEIPSRWGGGAFTEAELIAAPSLEPELRSLGALASGRVAKVGLLLVTNEAVVACTTSGATVLLKRDLIEVLVLKEAKTTTGGGSVGYDCPRRR